MVGGPELDVLARVESGLAACSGIVSVFRVDGSANAISHMTYTFWASSSVVSVLGPCLKQ